MFSGRGLNASMQTLSFCNIVDSKETIHRKSKDQQKVLKFKKTSPFFQNLFIESRFLNGSTAPLATISASKRFHSERI